MQNTEKHEHWMQAAIELAAKNRNHPFAAIIIDDELQQPLGSGVNDSASHPLLHGEIVAIQSCERETLKSDAPKTLYSTAEPCPMCMAAIIWSGIETVCFGTTIQTLTGLGWMQIDIPASQIVEKSPRKVAVHRHVLEDECDALFKAASNQS